MADLEALQAFADQHDFGLTAPLSHAQVQQLAEYWLPHMCFYWDERFHPVTLDDMFDMVEGPFAALPPAVQEAWRVGVLVREGSAAVVRAFDPPVVGVPDGTATRLTPQGPVQVNVWRVLNDGSPGRPALRLPEVNEDTVATHGASFDRANRFFGPLRTLAGGNTAVPGDPFLARADEPDPDQPGERRPRFTVMATFVNLLELLKYELIVADADAEPGFDYPPDGLRDFAVVNSLIRRGVHDVPDFPADEQRKFLLDAIAAHLAGGQLPQPPPGWRLDRVAWNAVTRFAFLEYHFFYAYNDFERYQTALFDNEHEGDDEGCCLVFDRGVLNVAASRGPEVLRTAVPHSIITSVHEEYQNADIFTSISPPILQPGQPAPPARKVVDFTVYVAGGSHATYLTGGNHDVVDFQDTWSYVAENAPWLFIAAPLVLATAIILAIIEHFVDTEDFTSDKGLHGGPADIVGEDPAGVATDVVVLPMSADDHIYQRGHEELLALRAFAGKWGGHDGIIDKSPPFTPKTGRYFRKLVDKL